MTRKANGQKQAENSERIQSVYKKQQKRQIYSNSNV